MTLPDAGDRHARRRYGRPGRCHRHGNRRRRSDGRARAARHRGRPPRRLPSRPARPRLRTVLDVLRDPASCSHQPTCPHACRPHRSTRPLQCARLLRRSRPPDLTWRPPPIAAKCAADRRCTVAGVSFHLGQAIPFRAHTATAQLGRLIAHAEACGRRQRPDRPPVSREATAT